MSSPSDSPAASTVDVLAANRTHRPDPLNSFEMYTGGWNISDVHYLASAGYTGMPGFVISLLWVLLGFGMLLVAGFMLLCCPNNLKAVPDFGSFGNYTTLGLLILFTVFTICGCGSLFTGQEALHSDLSTMFTYLMTQVDEAANEIVSNLPPIAAPRAALSAAVVEKATNSTSTSIHHDLDEMRLWLIILTATMLVLALIGLGEDKRMFLNLGSRQSGSHNCVQI
ncbi:hypothetical protein M758_6G040500 [Ceratodon purpureus]|nr:hypothetical protein M758_6G040500 [Ceratodon purpureus]